MKNLNPFQLKVGDLILAYNTGLHRITHMEPTEDESSINVTYNQEFTIEGKQIVLNRTAVCDISQCKPCYFIVPEVNKKIEMLTQLLRFINAESKK